MARKDSWMPLDVGDYLRDTGHLTTAEHGAYLLLLMHGWVRGGALPAEDERLRAMTKMDGREWKRSRDAVLTFFTLHGDAYRQKRLDVELAKTDRLVEQRSVAGKASAEARRRQRNFNENPTAVATEASTEAQRECQQTANEIADLYKGTKSTKKAATSSDSDSNFARDISGQDHQPPTSENGYNGWENGREVVGRHFWDMVWPMIVDAARIDLTRWTGNEIPARKWLRELIDPEVIITAIKRCANRPDYVVPNGLGYFDKPVRQQLAKASP